MVLVGRSCEIEICHKMLRLNHKQFRRYVQIPRPYFSRHISSSKSCLTRDNGKWVCKLFADEKLYVYGHKVGTKHTTMHYTLNSRKPISADIMERALKHLTRGFPPYHLRIRERDGDLWFFKSDGDVKLDIKVCEKGTPKHQAIDEICRPFDEANGPMSRYVMIPADDNDPCPFPDLKTKYPYQYYLLGCPHHAVTDGLSETLFASHIPSMLSTILEGKEIDDSPLGVYKSNEECISIYEQYAQEFLQNHDELTHLKNEISRANKQPLLLEAFPPPRVETPCTRHIKTELDATSVKKISVKCKERGITFGNAFQGITTTALVELVQEAGVIKDAYDISVLYTADIRRYLEKEAKPILGLHMRKMNAVYSVDRNVRDQFWSNCTKIQSLNRDLLKNKSIIKQEVVRQLFLPYTLPEDFYKSKPELTVDFQYNNIGNVRDLGSNEHVIFTNAENYFQIHLSKFPFYHQLFSFKGNVISILSYATDSVTDQTAVALVEKIKCVFKHFSE
ncbi:uncharacterized protein LOC135223557 isoform X1 [Macrobrachium nipponense]|uniref:uncharacterized protein LOC135223557 isoform X1 n=3 Tax=Macrobrachium nipponense TaxID=159736 RepID=UPI0030C8B220